MNGKTEIKNNKKEQKAFKEERKKKLKTKVKKDVRTEIKDVAVKEEKKVETEKSNKIEAVAETPVSATKETQMLPKKRYHLIVASLATAIDAQQVLESYRQKGYTEASVIEGSGRFRISLYNYSDRATANNKLNELKKEETYKTAWLLTSK